MKAGTRDLDVLVEDGNYHGILVDALEACGYTLVQPQDLASSYQELSATALQNVDGLRWEIFVRFVAKKLFLSKQ